MGKYHHQRLINYLETQKHLFLVKISSCKTASQIFIFHKSTQIQLYAKVRRNAIKCKVYLQTTVEQYDLNHKNSKYLTSKIKRIESNSSL